MLRPYKAGTAVVGVVALIAALSQLPTIPGMEEEEAPDMSKICFVDNEAPNYDYESAPRPPLTWLDKQSSGVELTPEHGVPNWMEGEVALIPSPGGFYRKGGISKCQPDFSNLTYSVSEPASGWLIAIAAPIILFSLRKYG